MKKTALFFLVLSYHSVLTAQLTDGLAAPNWTLTDITGQSYTLFNDLNAGKHVILDFSATWCPPCWSYHNGGTLDDLYHDFGPTTGTDLLRVYYIEADGSTNLNCLYGQSGCNNSSLGNWTAVPYPIFSPTGSDLNIVNDYDLAYYPTIYIVNGKDGRIFETGQGSYNFMQNLMLQSFELEVFPTTTNETCASLGSVSLDANGGFGTLNYTWSSGHTSPTASNLTAGTYYCTVTDAYGYFIERGPYTVGFDASNSNIQIQTITLSHVSCHGANDGTISILATGGGPYNYYWSNGQTGNVLANVPAGIYSVFVVGPAGCEATKFYTLDQPSQINIDVDQLDPDCQNENGVINASNSSGGSGIFSYTLSDSINYTGYFDSLAEGEYSLKITDQNNCEIEETLILTALNVPLINLIVPEVLDCNIDQVEIHSTDENDNEVYLWRRIPSGDTLSIDSIAFLDLPGNYELMITDTLSGCSSVDTTEVFGDFEIPEIQVNNQMLTCEVSEVTLCADIDSLTTIHWMVDGIIVHQQCINVSIAGDYIATAIGANGCVSSDTAVVMINNDLPQASLSSSENLDCIITETIIEVSISGDLSEFNIVWLDESGTEIISDIPFITVNMPGTYFARVQDLITGCTVQVSHTVVQNLNYVVPAFDASFDLDNMYLIDNSLGDPMSWSWTIDGIEVSNDQNPIIELSGHEVYEICLEVTNECGPETNCRTIYAILPLVINGNIKDVSCFGFSDGQIILFVEHGVAPFSYNWTGPNAFSANTKDIFDLQQGNYHVVVQDANQSVLEMSFNIAEPEALIFEYFDILPEINNNSNGAISIEVSGGNPSYSYLWSNGITNQNIEGLISGTYQCTITDLNGCELTSDNFEVGQLSEVSQLNEIEFFEVSPNPFEAELQLNLALNKKNNVTLSIIDVTGKLVKRTSYMQVKRVNEKISLSELKLGVYRLLLEYKGKIASQTIVKI